MLYKLAPFLLLRGHAPLGTDPKCAAKQDYHQLGHSKQPNTKQNVIKILTKLSNLFIENWKCIGRLGQDRVSLQIVLFATANFLTTVIADIGIVFSNFTDWVRSANYHTNGIDFVQCNFDDNLVILWAHELNFSWTKETWLPLTFWWIWLKISWRFSMRRVTSMPSILVRPEHHKV